MTWKDGFRVVDLRVLASQMYCKQCRSILDLNRTKKEKQIGFASVLSIVCSCGADNMVHTAERRVTESGDIDYTINFKAAISIKKSNLSIRKLHDFFTDLHIPCLPASKKSLAAVVPSVTQSSRVASPSPASVPAPSVTQPIIQRAKSEQALQTVNPSFHHQSTHVQAHAAVRNFSEISQSHSLSQVSSNVTVKALPVPLPVSAGPQKVDNNKAKRKQMFVLPSTSVGRHFRFSWCSAPVGAEEEEWASSLPHKPGDEMKQMFETGEGSGSGSDGTPDSLARKGDSYVSDAGAEEVDPIPRAKSSPRVVICLERMKEPVPCQTGEPNSAPGSLQEEPQIQKGLDSRSTDDFLGHFTAFNKPENGSSLTSVPNPTPQSLKSKPAHVTHREKNLAEPPPHKQGIRPENQFCCLVCDFHFSTFKSLNRHQTKKHGPEFARMQKKILFARETVGEISNGLGADVEATKRTNKKGKSGDQSEMREDGYKNENGADNKEAVLEAAGDAKSSEAKGVSGSPEAATTDQSSKASQGGSGYSNPEIKEEREQLSELMSEQFSLTPRLVPPKVKCKFCPAEFRYQCELRLHTLKHTGARPHSCDVCGKAFRLLGILNRHKREHTGEMPYACGQCNQRFQDSTVLNRHIRTEHGVKEGQGTRSRAVKSNRSRRARHYNPTASKDEQEDGTQVEEGAVKIKVEAADVSTAQTNSPTAGSAAGLKSAGQGEEEDGKRTFRCQVCSALFPCTRSFAQHMKLHPEVKDVHRCPRCDRSFRYVRDYYAHMRSVHGMQLFVCPDCGKTYKQSTTLKEHRLKHSGQRPFMCESCGRTYIRANDLRRHERLHTNDRAFRCRVCGNTYLQLTHLINHQRSHTGERPFVCEKCGKSFPQRSTLYLHMKTHREELGVIECERCGKRLANQRTFEKHQESCTGIFRKRFGDYRDFICQKCGKDCKRRQGINYHRKVGCKGPTQTESMREFIGADADGSYCTKCNRRFLNRHRLMYHLRKVCGKGQLLNRPDPNSSGYCMCPNCGQEFASKHRRHYHMITHCTEKTARGKEPVDRDAPGYCMCAHCGEEFATKGKRKYHVMKLCTQRKNSEGKNSGQQTGKIKVRVGFSKVRGVAGEGERSGGGVKQEGLGPAAGEIASYLESGIPPKVQFLY